MKALVVNPRVAGSLRLEDRAEPNEESGTVLVETLAVGVCGTDMEIVAGEYGWAPEGRDRLVLGHESLGRVLATPVGVGLTAGDLVVPMVRHPDPAPCPSCSVGEWDFCRTDTYLEHGIRKLDGFAAERFRVRPDRLVRLPPALDRSGVLLEPASVVVKAWEQIERIGARATWSPRRVLVTGAGPIGLLAALAGIARGLEVEVLDRVETGVRPALVEALGARFRAGPVDDTTGVDVVVECTGDPAMVLPCLAALDPAGVLCCLGRSIGANGSGGAGTTPTVNLCNRAVVGTVNANRRHYEAAVALLAAADPEWLGRLLSRNVPFEAYPHAFERRDGDVKVVLSIASSHH